MDQLNRELPKYLAKKIIIDTEKVRECIYEGDVMNKKSINLELSEITENNISNVREHLKLPDDTTTMIMAIALCSKLIDDKKSGRELRIHEKNGEQYRIDFKRGNL